MRENVMVVGKQRGEDPVNSIPKTFKPKDKKIAPAVGYFNLNNKTVTPKVKFGKTTMPQLTEMR
jgi:hypothetical protein